MEKTKAYARGKHKHGRSPKKEYDPELLMQELIDTVSEIYQATNEIKATALELSFPPNKVKKLLITAGVLRYTETEQIRKLLTQGIKEGEPNPRIVYADIIEHARWQPKMKHPRMSLYDRSAQFAAYKALSGYEDMVEEEARLTDKQIELEECELEMLNQKLTLIADVIEDGVHPTVSITYFVPDTLKAGGKYVTVTEEVKKIDPVARKVILMSTEGRAGSNKAIDIDRIIGITGDLVDYMDDGTE